MAKLTPAMQQFMDAKQRYPDCIIFFRMGDFYEMFFDDAIEASKALDIALTARDCGLPERAPMCGVPHHSAEGYIRQLIDKGYKVAICEQLTDPKESKGLVERDVIRVITKGTVIEPSMLDEGSNNFLLSLTLLNGAKTVGIAACDLSTGQFELGELELSDGYGALLDELMRYNPSEIVVDHEMFLYINAMEDEDKSFYLTKAEGWEFELEYAAKQLKQHFSVVSLDGFGCAELKGGISAAGALLVYLGKTQKTALNNITSIKIIEHNRFMGLDLAARRNLELTQSISGVVGKGTLLHLLDKTRTTLGKRRLKNWIEQPLQSIPEIESRYDAIDELLNDLTLLPGLREALFGIHDMERLASRCALGAINARDLIALKGSLEKLPDVSKLLGTTKSALMMELHLRLDTLEDICELLQNAIEEEPPTTIKEGGIIRMGFDELVDRLRMASTHGKELMLKLEAEEREATGIKNLKIGYNRVFGYYIEVTKSFQDKVPYRYTRKQTLANAERYITEELKEMEETILGAQEKLQKLEYELFIDIRDSIAAQIQRLQRSAQAIAEVDVLCSLSKCAMEYNYVRPSFHEGTGIYIEAGRHPVVERMLKREMFVPNDATIDGESNRCLIITGPNMSGKSTYMRQIALIVIMAHIGSFIPAKSAQLSLVDKVFTRIGASDDLASGKSTFMVEMSEVASILRNATNRSLLILDEIGRGTSTFDGLSIAWAVLEHIADAGRLGARTLFSTHYHELSELEGSLEGVRNYRIQVKESGDDVIFLRRIARGGSDKSFGIHVARFAGVPKQVTERANQILMVLEQAELGHAKLLDEMENFDFTPLVKTKSDSGQTWEEYIERIDRLDLTVVSPIEALNLLYSLQAQAQEFKSGEANVNSHTR